MRSMVFSTALSAGYDLGFAAFHLAFWRLFRWREALAKLDFVNRCIVQILNLRLTYVFLMTGGLLAWIAWRGEQGALAAAIAGGMALFWLLRAIEQVWFFGYRNALSNSFTLLFALGAVVHAAAAQALWPTT